MQLTKGFIFAYPRSGSSVLRLILNQHNEIIAAPECGFLEWLSKDYESWNNAYNYDEKINLFINDLLQTKKIETWNLDKKNLIRIIRDANPANYEELTTLVYMSIGNGHEKLVLDKNNYYSFIPERVLRIWSNTMNIYLIRDPRDVIASIKKLSLRQSKEKYSPNYKDFDITQISDHWFKVNEIIYRLKLEEKENFSIVIYENLVKHPNSILDELLKGFGLDFNEGLLDYFQIQDPDFNYSWKEKTKGPLTIDNIGSYTSILDQIELRIVEETCLDLYNQIIEMR